MTVARKKSRKTDEPADGRSAPLALLMLLEVLSFIYAKNIENQFMNWQGKRH
jgi:hypothetical protein